VKYDMAELVDIKLFPDDIPGSNIDDESRVAKWTVDKLKFWLKCRRLNQQGKKNDLVVR
jgi:hypothetical protein